MKTISPSRTALLVGALLFAPVLAQAAAPTKAEYNASKTTIGDTYKADKAACASLKDNAKDICVEEAKAKENNSRADLEFNYSGKPADGAKVKVVMADGVYAVAKERCDDLSGNPKDVCNKEAKAAHVAALASAKTKNVTAEVKAEGKEDVNDAKYKVATEKCDAMSGDAKSSCVQAAKKTFGKL